MDYTTGLNYLISGAKRLFQAANPSAGLNQGTELTYPWFNDVQGELINIVTSAGLSPTAATPTQVLQGLARIFGGNVTAVSASQALTADNAGLIRVNASAGNIVITLPLANSAGGSPIPFFFVREDTSSNTATVLDAGSNEDIPGDVTSFGVTPGNPVTILGDGGSLWEILSPNLSGFATTAALASGVAAAEAVATGVQTALQTYLAVGSYAAPELTFQPTLGNNYSGSSITLGSGTWTCMGWSALDPDYSTLFVRIA